MLNLNDAFGTLSASFLHYFKEGKVFNVSKYDPTSTKGILRDLSGLKLGYSMRISDHVTLSSGGDFSISSNWIYILNQLSNTTFGLITLSIETSLILTLSDQRTYKELLIPILSKLSSGGQLILFISQDIIIDLQDLLLFKLPALFSRLEIKKSLTISHDTNHFIFNYLNYISFSQNVPL